MKKTIRSNFVSHSTPLNDSQWSIFQKLIIDLSDIQKIWVSGYLYGLVVSGNHEFNSCNRNMIVRDNKNDEKSFMIYPAPAMYRPIITILSASQTGNARQLGEKLYQILTKEQFSVRLVSVADYNVKKISQEKLLFLIISTYGEGEPPEEALILYKYLFSKHAPNMKNIYFSVFGLGDSSYEHFSQAAKDFDRRLEELGASRLYQRVDADLDYEGHADNWRQEILCVLKDQFIVFNTKDTNFISDSGVDNVIRETSNKNVIYCNLFTRENPFCARLLVRQKITSRNSVKDVYHLEIDLSGSGLYYQPGDTLGVWYENDPNLIHELLQYCDFTGKEEININNKLLPFDVVLQKYYELTNNTSEISKKYAVLIDNHELLDLFVDDAELKLFVASTSIIDMIRCWTPKKIIPTQLLSILRPLTPRFYSISSSQVEVGEEVHITVGVVRYEVNGYIRTGGATGYLVDRVSESSELRVFIMPNKSFRLPIDSNTSIIMIAAGTGIAPFRAFMQQRSLDRALGKNWLFFGNLCFLDDFLYQCEWQKYFKDGLLTNIDTAWSREQENKVYVQDKIIQHGLEIWKWVEGGAHVYVCGNADRMACAVEKVLIQLGVQYGKMSFVESSMFWKEMRINHRYQKDVY